MREVTTALFLTLLVASPMDGQTRQRSDARCPVMRAELGFAFQSEWEEGEDEETWRETIIVVEVFDDTAADGMLEAGDQIRRVNGLVATTQLFWSLRRTLEPGDSVRVRVLRDGGERELTLRAREPAEREDTRTRCSNRCDQPDR